ncbi:MAG: FUSC family protein [Homoserinimonas sp.]
MTRSSFWGAIRRTMAPIVHPTRVLLALKTAIAAGLAWPVAHLLPGTVDEYSYYAPLGALISMMPTMLGSLRASLQTALGLALGIGLAWAVLESPLPGVASVPLAVGIGVLLGGLRGFGAGRDYVAIAALFVLVVGGSQADDYSLGFLVQMGVGMAIGIAVNLIIVPPLHFTTSANEITALRKMIAENLESMSYALVETWPPEHQDWLDGAKSLDSSVRVAEPIIEEAGESRRINPRARWHEYDVQEDFDDLEAIGVLGRHTLDLGETIGAAIWADPVPVGLPEELCEPLSGSLAKTADLVRAWNNRSGEREALREAERALDTLSRREGDLPSPGQEREAVHASVFTLRRMLAVIQARIDPPSA